MSDNLDNVPDGCLHLLKEDELVTIYNNRKGKADMVLGQITMRSILHEQTREQNKHLWFLLRECRDTDCLPEDLQERVSRVLEGEESERITG